MTFHDPLIRPTVRSVFAISVLAIILAVPATAVAAVHTVQVGDDFFAPADLTIQPGDSVTWTNIGNNLHNVRADDDSFRCAEGCDGQGGDGGPSAASWSFTLTFDDPGENPYFCEVHGAAGGIGMAGAVTVAQAPQPGAVAFTSSSYSAGEGSASAPITAVRSGGSDGQVTVDFATSDGSADAGSDYQASSGTLIWADGEDGQMSFQVPLIDDSQPEGDETVNLALSSPGGGAALGSPSTATLTIVDDDTTGGEAGALSFTQAEYSVSEGDSEAVVEVERSGGTSGTVSARVESSDGSATAGEDYMGVSMIVTFGDGQTGPVGVAIPLIDDGVAEGNETINAALSAPTGGASLGDPSAATVTVMDDDLPAGPCEEDDHTLCFQEDRFEVRVRFEDPAKPELGFQNATKVDLTDRAGLFYFFQLRNIEMLVKVLDDCSGATNRFWVFFSATTNVAFEVVVVDTEAGKLRRYTNPANHTADPVADTDAFDTCS